MKRHQILLGAGTTAGGVVVTATSHARLNGVHYALEGDLIDCPACMTQGSIRCVEPRMRITSNGKLYALENDLCSCLCRPLPQLIANQSVCSQYAAADSLSLLTPTTRADSNPEASKVQAIPDFDEQTKLIAKRVAGLPFYIETSDGRAFSGRVGTDGLLPRIETIGKSEYTVYWGDEALNKMSD